MRLQRAARNSISRRHPGESAVRSLADKPATEARPPKKGAPTGRRAAAPAAGTPKSSKNRKKGSMSPKGISPAKAFVNRVQAAAAPMPAPKASLPPAASPAVAVAPSKAPAPSSATGGVDV